MNCYVRGFAAVLLLVMLSACGRLDTHRYVYLEGREGQTLRIPEGMDTPYRDETRRISEGTSVAASSGNPRELERPPALLLPGMTLDNENGFDLRFLQIADEPESVLRRAALALERSSDLRLRDRDNENLRLQVEVLTLPASTQPSGRWWTRIFRRGPSAAAALTPVWVKISPDGDASRVDVVDDAGRAVVDDRASRVLAILSERLG